MTQSNILLNSAGDSEKKNIFISFLSENLNDFNIFHKDADPMRFVQKISVEQL